SAGYNGMPACSASHSSLLPSSSGKGREVAYVGVDDLLRRTVAVRNESCEALTPAGHESLARIELIGDRRSIFGADIDAQAEIDRLLRLEVDPGRHGRSGDRPSCAVGSQRRAVAQRRMLV